MNYFFANIMNTILVSKFYAIKMTIDSKKVTKSDRICNKVTKSDREKSSIFVFDKSDFIGVIQALAFLMECQGFAVKREQTAGEAGRSKQILFRFIN